MHPLGQRILAGAEVGELAAQLLTVARRLGRCRRAKLGEGGLQLVHHLAAQLRGRQAGVLGQHVLGIGLAAKRGHEQRALQVEQLEVVAVAEQRLGGRDGIGKVERVAVVGAVGLDVVGLEAHEVHVEVEQRVAEARVVHEVAGDLLLRHLEEGFDVVVGADAFAGPQQLGGLVDPPALFPERSRGSC